MTVKEFYKQAKKLGKEDYEMIAVKMGKDRTYIWHEVKPRYGISVNVVFMEICSGLKCVESDNE